ncbi:hypothetical protein [uncultured Alsobacter sp.]|uniref:hypothetical protein n=1 Tax=uncultured Alsobacter sp. TaxID=1748258 RepID=UPI0025DA04B1|nr:hypothetical protein [uncultured Alsobacter sp.]
MTHSSMRRSMALGALAAGLCLGGTAARADSIDGNWCNSTNNKQMQIVGTMIVTPGGKKLQGSYSRHTFAYTIPDTETPAGAPASLQLVNENRISATFGSTPAEMWHRCEQTS